MWVRDQWTTSARWTFIVPHRSGLKSNGSAARRLRAARSGSDASPPGCARLTDLGAGGRSTLPTAAFVGGTETHPALEIRRKAAHERIEHQVSSRWRALGMEELELP